MDEQRRRLSNGLGRNVHLPPAEQGTDISISSDGVTDQTEPVSSSDCVEAIKIVIRP